MRNIYHFVVSTVLPYSDLVKKAMRLTGLNSKKYQTVLQFKRSTRENPDMLSEAVIKMYQDMCSLNEIQKVIVPQNSVSGIIEVTEKYFRNLANHDKSHQRKQYHPVCDKA